MKSLKIGIVAKDRTEFEAFVINHCSSNDSTYMFIQSFETTNSINLDLVLLANGSMVDLFNKCRCLVR